MNVDAPDRYAERHVIGILVGAFWLIFLGVSVFMFAKTNYGYAATAVLGGFLGTFIGFIPDMSPLLPWPRYTRTFLGWYFQFEMALLVLIFSALATLK